MSETLGLPEVWGNWRLGGDALSFAKDKHSVIK